MANRGRLHLTWLRPWPMLPLLVTVVVAPLLLGGVFGWGMATIAGLAGLSLALACRWPPRFQGRAVMWAAAALALGVLVTGLQLVPWPCGWLETFAPAAVADARASQSLLGHTAEVCQISRAPGRTREEWVKGLAVLATFLAAALVATRGYRRHVFGAVGASAAGLAVVALGHELARAERVFGLYEPVYAHPTILSPLLNPNHLGGFLAMGVPVLLGLALDERSRVRQVVWSVAAVVTMGTAVLTLSRGTLAALVLGPCLLGGFAWIRRGQGWSRLSLRPLAALVVLTAAGLALGVYTAFEGVERELAAGSHDKLEVMAAGAGLAFETPWLGVGRGAYSASFVRLLGTGVRYEYPENILIQWATEWGLVTAALVLLGLGAALARSVQGARSFARLGALAGVLTIAAHNMVDYSLELVGVSVAAVALLGAAVQRPRDSGARNPVRRGARVWVPAVAAVTLASALWIGPSLDANGVHQLRVDLEAAQREQDRTAFHGILRRALRQHPAEPAFPLLAGAEAVQHRDAKAPSWLNRAMELAPGWFSPRLVAADWLRERGAWSQASLEVRAAAERDRKAASQYACRVLGSGGAQADFAIDAASSESEGLAFLDEVASCLPLASPTGERIDHALVSRSPKRTAPRVRRARRHLIRGEARQGLAEAERAQQASPRTQEAMLVLVEAWLANDQPRRALRRCKRALRDSGDPDAWLRLQAEAQAALGDLPGMRQTVEQLRGTAAGRPADLASTMHLLGRLEAQTGNRGRALRAYEEAQRFRPDDGNLRRIARFAEGLGDRRRALAAYTELCNLSGRRGPACQDRDRLAGRSFERYRLPGRP